MAVTCPTYVETRQIRVLSMSGHRWALPKMAEKATDKQLKQGFLTHLDETKTHVQRLEQGVPDAWRRGQDGRLSGD